MLTTNLLTLLRISRSSGDSRESNARASDTEAGNSAAVVAWGNARVQPSEPRAAEVL